MTEDRLEAVSELVENPQLHQVLKNALPRFQDIELILSLCVQVREFEYVDICDRVIFVVNVVLNYWLIRSSMFRGGDVVVLASL